MNHVSVSRQTGRPAITRALARWGALALALGCALALVAAAAHSQAPVSNAANAPQSASTRIGTYDSRAVAVAYVRSERFAQTLKDLQRQRADAAKAGDKKRVDELEAQGQAMQVRINLQGFSVAPITDIMDSVHDSLPEVARRMNVGTIAREADYHAGSVELVDVTDELVRLFNPDAQTLKIIGETRKTKPLAIESAAKIPAKS